MCQPWREAPVCIGWHVQHDRAARGTGRQPGVFGWGGTPPQPPASQPTDANYKAAMFGPLPQARSALLRAVGTAWQRWWRKALAVALTHLLALCRMAAADSSSEPSANLWSRRTQSFRRIGPARGPPVWADRDAQMDDAAQIDSDCATDWDGAAQPAPDFDVDQRVS